MSKTLHPVIYLVTNWQLQDRNYYVRLWRAVRSLNYSRRQWRERLSDMLRDYNGAIHYAPGVPFKIPLVDDVFGNDEGMRWLSYYLKADTSDRRPLMKSRSFERLRLLDLYIRIHHPEKAR
jgi:hypothetical protein